MGRIKEGCRKYERGGVSGGGGGCIARGCERGEHEGAGSAVSTVVAVVASVEVR